MSSRAIRRLREEREAAERQLESESEEEEEENVTGQKRAAFLAMVDEESSSEEDVSDGDGGEEEGEDSSEKLIQESEVEPKKISDSLAKEEQEPQEQEDLDALLAEFATHDKKNTSATPMDDPSIPSWFAVIVNGMDARDLDIDYVMRTSLLGNDTEDSAPSRSQRRATRLLFGPPRDEWAQQRPPHYIGGGLGMTSYQDEPRTLPWPYTMEGTVGQDEVDLSRWFTFIRSDTYQRDFSDYERIQQTGDVNALALYVAHHPFVVEALLQLCMVLYQTSQSQEGLSVLKRCLWVYECSTLAGFTPLDSKKSFFMDYDLKENASYFHALFRLIQVSGVAGCIRTCLAVSRYLLSLNPLCDPMGVLLLLDYYGLATLTSSHDQFVVDLVESQRIQIHYREPASEKQYQCELLDLPNWSYSYALALHRLHLSDPDVVSLDRASEALVSAIQKFPKVVEMLLDKNEVDKTGRSFQTDWPSVLVDLRNRMSTAQEEELDPTLCRSASTTCDLMIQIFVDRNHKLWSSNKVLLWLYENCCNLGAPVTGSIKTAFCRYKKVDPDDYKDRFRTLPPDANPLDPNLVGPALAIDPNRRRFLRQDWNNRREQLLEQQAGARFGGNLLQIGGPPTNVIDPDLPMLEVLWRSLLPWNTVEGMPPPRG